MDDDLKRVLVALQVEVMSLRRDLAVFTGKSAAEGISDAERSSENLQRNLKIYGLDDPSLELALGQALQAFQK